MPKNWLAVTVLTEEQNGLFPLGTMDSFYSDNENPVYNFVPAAFAVGAQEEIVEIQTNCGRLIYAYHAPSPSPITADSAKALLGKAIFEYYCTVVGPLAPYNAYISGMNTDWLKPGGQPGLYPFDPSHSRTMDLLQNQPLVEFHPWEFNICPFTTCTSNQPAIPDMVLHTNFLAPGFLVEQRVACCSFPMRMIGSSAGECPIISRKWQ